MLPARKADTSGVDCFYDGKSDSHLAKLTDLQDAQRVGAIYGAMIMPHVDVMLDVSALGEVLPAKNDWSLVLGTRVNRQF